MTNIFEDYETMEHMYKSEIVKRDKKLKEVEGMNSQLLEELKKLKGAKNE